jgi:phosphonate transport system substrate-binding protein
MSSVRENNPPQHSFSMTRVLLVAVPLGILCGWLAKSYLSRLEAETRNESESVVLKQILNTDTAEKSKLNARFTDADGDLVADPPKDPAQQILPEVLVFSYVANPKAESERSYWQPFADFLAKRTGKKVELAAFNTDQEQLAALKNGKLHITGFNTGNVETAVNECGFVPICVPGHADGTFGYQMKMIVPTNSAIKSVSDLKKRMITFTQRSSNSGYKAPVFILKEEGLLPERDYRWQFAIEHEDSIRGIARGEFDVAPVASDMLQRSIKKGDIAEDGFRVIKESEWFPPAAIGYVYNLSPALASDIRAAFLNFSITDTELAQQFSDATRFVPVSYKTDFELIRKIDDAVKGTPDIIEPASEPSEEPAVGATAAG